MAMADEYQALSADDRRQAVETRRRALESEKWQHTVNRVSAADTSSFDERIAEIDKGLEELDRLEATIE